MMELDGKKFIMKAEITKPPTYLREFFVNHDEMVLVYQMEAAHDKSNSEYHIRKEHSESSSYLDLTGNPLKVDLDGDESFGSYAKTEKLNHWSPEESQHFPCTLQAARTYINAQNKVKICKGGTQKAIYVVCDGSDSLCTVLLGAQRCKDSIMTTQVHIIGCYPKGHKALSLEHMENDHMKNTQIKNPKVDFLVKFNYCLYGTVLKKVLKDCFDHYGSISVEVTCNKCVFDVPRNPSSMKMVLQIVAGHHLSSVYFLWEDLCLLQRYLDILSDPDQYNDDGTIIPNTPIQKTSIHESINNLIVRKLQREAKVEFSLKNIRQEHILDKLWSILKCCETIGVLQDSLHYFFQRLVEANSTIRIPENDKSNIAIIINDIVNGKLAVPTLSFPQALEILLELGAEKLKNDYQIIIKNYYSAADQGIASRWSKFKNEKLMSQTGSRKIRITATLGPGVNSLNNNISKLGYLGKLHIATELIYLIKDQANLPAETFDNFCDSVYKHYVHKESGPHEFIDLQQSSLCEFSFVLNSANTNIIEKETSPVIWVMQMNSKVRNLEVTTTYHLSEYPIFPPVIYNNYDVSNVVGENQMVYYVSKLQKYKQFI